MIDERDLTDDERAAIADEPRRGRWALSSRELSQHGTDVAIAHELWKRAADADSAVVVHREAVAPWITIDLPEELTIGARAAGPLEQRGGIHSDPLVRLLAFRAWGNRDRLADRIAARITLTSNFDRPAPTRVPGPGQRRDR